VVLIALTFFKNAPTYIEKTEILLGTVVKVVISSEKNSFSTSNVIFNEIRRIENKFSVNIDSSIISQINRNGSEITEIDEEARLLIERSLSFAEVTEGAFDPALGTLIKLWGFDKISSEDFIPKIPQPEEIHEALSKSGYKNVELVSGGIRLLNGAQLDLGGIAKGYAIDMAVQKAKAVDPKATGFIDAGGDIGIIGPKFGGEKWSIGIRNPRGESPGEIIVLVYLDRGSIVTSGDYERYFEINGKRYHHIINPFTGYPSEETVSSSVISIFAVDADALSTASFVMGSSFSLQILPPLGGQAFLVNSKQDVFKTAGWNFFEKN